MNSICAVHIDIQCCNIKYHHYRRDTSIRIYKVNYCAYLQSLFIYFIFLCVTDRMQKMIWATELKNKIKKEKEKKWNFIRNNDLGPFVEFLARLIHFQCINVCSIFGRKLHCPVLYLTFFFCLRFISFIFYISPCSFGFNSKKFSA